MHIRNLVLFATLLALAASATSFSENFSTDQNSNKDGWGPWRYTWKETEVREEYWSGIRFRTKCVSNSGTDSKWLYQFRSRYDHTMDFVERVQHSVDGAPTNDFARPEAVALEGGGLSPEYETMLHGTCEQLAGHDIPLKIEVMCVTQHDRYGESNDPCFQDESGTPLEFKPPGDNSQHH
jgi:hypothetical protein